MAAQYWCPGDTCIGGKGGNNRNSLKVITCSLTLHGITTSVML